MGDTVGGEQRRGRGVTPRVEEERASPSLMALSVSPGVQPPVALPTPNLDAQNRAADGLNAAGSALGADDFGLGETPRQAPLLQAVSGAPLPAPTVSVPAATTGSTSAVAPSRSGPRTSRSTR